MALVKINGAVFGNRDLPIKIEILDELDKACSLDNFSNGNMVSEHKRLLERNEKLANDWITARNQLHDANERITVRDLKIAELETGQYSELKENIKDLRGENDRLGERNEILAVAYSNLQAEIANQQLKNKKQADLITKLIAQANLQKEEIKILHVDKINLMTKEQPTENESLKDKVKTLEFQNRNLSKAVTHLQDCWSACNAMNIRLEAQLKRIKEFLE